MLNDSMAEAPAPDLTVIVPALNEEDTIREVVERLLKLPFPTQVIVVNDGSTDRTSAVLKEFGDRIQVLTNTEPGGKGAAIRKALPHARGRAVIIQDADLEYFPEEIPIDPDHTLHQLTGRFQSVRDGLPELIKNSKDQYSRLGIHDRGQRRVGRARHRRRVPRLEARRPETGYARGCAQGASGPRKGRSPPGLSSSTGRNGSSWA